LNRQGVPSRELFEHFLLAVRPYFYPVGKPEEEKRQAEHALYLFCLHNITDSFAPKPTDNEVNLLPPPQPHSSFTTVRGKDDASDFDYTGS
jgi:hypothetical protein